MFFTAHFSRTNRIRIHLLATEEIWNHIDEVIHGQTVHLDQRRDQEVLELTVDPLLLRMVKDTTREWLLYFLKTETSLKLIFFSDAMFVKHSVVQIRWSGCWQVLSTWIGMQCISPAWRIKTILVVQTVFWRAKIAFHIWVNSGKTWTTRGYRWRREGLFVLCFWIVFSY